MAKTRREIILNTVDDLVSDFLFYDRKEDEELSADDLDDAIDQAEITVDEIVDLFRAKLTAGLGLEEDDDDSEIDEDDDDA